MAVAQGLALATTEAALYLHQSAQSLWRAWQASAHIHPSALHPLPSTSSQLGLKIHEHPPTDPHQQHKPMPHAIEPQDISPVAFTEMLGIGGRSKSWLPSQGGSVLGGQSSQTHFAEC